MPTLSAHCSNSNCLFAGKCGLRRRVRGQRAVAHAAETQESDVAKLSNEQLKDELRKILGEPELDEGELKQYDGVRCATSLVSVGPCYLQAKQHPTA